MELGKFFPKLRRRKTLLQSNLVIIYLNSQLVTKTCDKKCVQNVGSCVKFRARPMVSESYSKMRPIGI